MRSAKTLPFLLFESCRHKCLVCIREQTNLSKSSNYSKIFLLSPSIKWVLSSLGKKRKKKVLWPDRHTLELYLKLGMHTLFDSGSNTGWVLPDHTSSSRCVKRKIICSCVCMHVYVYQFSDQSIITNEAPFYGRHILNWRWFQSPKYVPPSQFFSCGYMRLKMHSRNEDTSRVKPWIWYWIHILTLEEIWAWDHLATPPPLGISG